MSAVGAAKARRARRRAMPEAPETLPFAMHCGPKEGAA